jgi:hypothetical protein
MLEPLAIVQGMMGLRTWLTEVQYLMTKLKQRSFGGMPLYVHSLPLVLCLFLFAVSSLRDIDPKRMPLLRSLGSANTQEPTGETSSSLVFISMASITGRCRESIPSHLLISPNGDELEDPSNDGGLMISAIWDVLKLK